MKTVGLTGGIGSGKTTVARMFSVFGVPVYIADNQAKILMNEDREIQKLILQLLGPESYTGDSPNRGYIASRVFSEPELLSKLNAIIHPAVAAHFTRWKEQQDFSYVLYEAAILFESGGYRKCDLNILVTAPEEVRIQRIQKREHWTLEEIKKRISNQWTDEKKRHLADFIIENINISETEKRVREIHLNILEHA